jgi:sugar/nucleoside kinase (ribokinase family)
MIPADLLIVGGLTIDRFADGRQQAGGSVLHGTRAARRAGWRVATLCTAGPEPEVTSALAELAAAGPSRVAWTATSIRFGIDERFEPRHLTLDHSPPMHLDPAWTQDPPPAATLVAPVAGEIDAGVLAALPRGISVALIQGWLRTVGPDRMVRPSPAGAMPLDVRAWLGRVDVVLASGEDLAADGPDPADQLRALRAACGSRPALIITLGADGYLVNVPGSDARRRPAARAVRPSTSVGAGDAFAALLAAAMGGGASVNAAAESAAEGVAAILEAALP